MSYKIPEIPSQFDTEKYLIHSSIEDRVNENYERLEFLGDSFLHLLIDIIMIQEFYLDSPSVANSLSTNENLSEWCCLCNLRDKIKSRFYFDEYDKINADVFEAYCGCWAIVFFENSKNINILKHWKTFYYWLRLLICECVCYSDSYCIEDRTRKRLGKLYLGFMISIVLYREYPEIDSGGLTVLRSRFYRRLKFNHQTLTEYFNYSTRDMYIQIGDSIYREINSVLGIENCWKSLLYQKIKTLFDLFLQADIIRVKDYQIIKEEEAKKTKKIIAQHKIETEEVNDMKESDDIYKNQLEIITKSVLILFIVFSLRRFI